MSEPKDFKYTETNGIPVCPICQIPTRRLGGVGTTTLMHFPPLYDENGVNINPNRNTSTCSYNCLKCGKSFGVSGNGYDSYKYSGL